MTAQHAPALSIRQPWAELILSGRKTMEIRSWPTDYRGLIWLHAGRQRDVALDTKFGLEQLVRGAFVGCVDLVSVVPIDPGHWERWRAQHLDDGPYQAGLFAWALAHPRRLRSPIAARGQVGLFAVEPDVRAALYHAETC